jgi:hypothetical protein
MSDIYPVIFRRGIFNLRTRRFGTAAELLIQRLLGAQKGRSVFHDLYDDEKNHRIEVKFSTVNTSSEAPITLSNLLEAIAQAGLERAVRFENDAWRGFGFDCNIQQIKTAEFDILYYGLFFAHVILIFRISTDIIPNDRKIYFSNKQHKGNVGEGHFHIHNQTLDHHLNTYLYKKISYQDFLDLLS